MRDITPGAHLEHFQRQRCMLISLSERLLTMLGILKGLKSLQVEVQQLKQHLSEDTLTVLVVGECNRGKSTIINALLGQKVLPAYPVQTTAVLTEVKWGEQPRAIVHYRPSSDGSLKQPQTVPITGIESYLVINADEENPYEYERVELFWPSSLCYDGMKLLDSPALDDGEMYLTATMNCVPSVDAVLFVLGCDSLPGREEALEIDRIKSASHEAIFFLCNRIDLVESHAQAMVKRRYLAYLSQFTRYSEQNIYFTNAKGALAGRINGDMAQLQQSNMLLVEDALYPFLVRQGRDRLMRYAAGLKTAVHRALYASVEEQQHLDDRVDRTMIALTDNLYALGRELDDLTLPTVW